MLHYYSDGGTYRINDNDTEVCIADFSVKVNRVDIYYDISGKEHERKYCVTYCNDRELGDDKIPDSILDKYSYSSYHPSLQLSPTVRGAAKEMAYYIRQLAQTAPSRKIIQLEQLGWHKDTDGNHLYCAGDTVISAVTSEDITIAPHLANRFRFEIDGQLSEADAAIGALNHIVIDEAYSSVVFATGINGILRQLILDADIRPGSITYLVGESQSRKTSLARLICLLYNRTDLQSTESGITRISSSEAKTEELLEEYKDATYIVDDLYRSKDRKVCSENERRLRNVIRNYADNSSRQTIRGGCRNNAQVLITGEYLLDTRTDIGRCFVINVKNKINSNSLSEWQQNPLVISTAYYYFIKWLCVRYDETVDRLRNGFAQFRRESYLHTVPYERLYEHAFLLQFSYELFLDYAVSVGAVGNEAVHNAKQAFRKILDNAINYQGDIMKTLEQKEQSTLNLSKVLLQLINNNNIITQKGGGCFKKHNYLYITCELFSDKIYELYLLDLSAKAIAKYFSDRHINLRDGNRNVVKYGKSGKRYLALDIDKLNADASSPEAEINSLF